MAPCVVPNEHDRFVVTRCRRFTATPSLGSVHTYDFTLADSGEPICRVRQSVTRFKENIGFYAGAARSGPLLYLAARERFDPWARYEVADGCWEQIGAIQKVFVARQQRSRYVLYDGDGDEVALVDAPLMAARSRRRAGGIAVAGAAGLVGVSVASVPVLPAVGVAGLVSLGTRGAIRELRERLDPVDAVSQLRITRDGQLLGSYHRRPRNATIGGGMMTIMLGSGAVPTVHEIDMTPDTARSVDRRLVFALTVALDALSGLFAESGLR